MTEDREQKTEDRGQILPFDILRVNSGAQDDSLIDYFEIAASRAVLAPRNDKV